MPRKPRGIHARPENAGAHNLPEGYADTRKDPDNSLQFTLPIYHIGQKNRRDYKGLWTEEQLETEIGNYFQYCLEHSVKPSKAGIGLWLGVGKDTMHTWVRESAKYGFKSIIAKEAFDLIESCYIERAEQYPTANLFLLRSSHNHVEKSQVDVNTSTSTTAEDVDEAIKKLGLDK